MVLVNLIVPPVIKYIPGSNFIAYIRSQKHVEECF